MCVATEKLNVPSGAEVISTLVHYPEEAQQATNEPVFAKSVEPYIFVPVLSMMNNDTEPAAWLRAWVPTGLNE